MQLPRSIGEAGRRLRAGEFTCAELMRGCLERIQALQPQLNALLTVTAEAALARAQALDAELRRQRDRGPLHGMPVIYKDCFDTAGVRTTLGSRLFAGRVPAADAEVVQRLSAAGAIMLGKTNMNEFAAGTSGKNAAYGDVCNPWSRDHSPGGSSSGTAAAVAAGLALAGVGSDTGGSIRIPAACTGTVGLRPTFGRIPTRGCFPRSFSLDTVAPLARTVADCALVFAAMAEEPAGGVDGAVAGVRIGVMRGFSLRGLDPEVESALSAALQTLRELGASVHEVEVPALEDARAAFMDILLYEFHQVLGEHWRGRADREALFGPVVRANLARGMAIGEPAYRAALGIREHTADAMRSAFSQVDALVTPVLPMLTPHLDAPAEVFDRERHFMTPFSLAGLPAIALPCGFSAEGLPIGMQIAAERLQERRLLRIAAAYEAAAGWHARLPHLP